MPAVPVWKGWGGTMSLFGEIERTVRELVPADGRPVVVYSAAWPFLRALRRNDREAVESLLTCTLDGLGSRTVLMPTFTDGYVDGTCDLDREPSITGALTECFRVRAGVRRTLSAFFSFAVGGGDEPDLLDAPAEHAWGPGSAYEWMERRDAHLLMLGTHPTLCSYLHRLEWLARDVVTFRYDKVFRGTLLREGGSIEATETLFVRRLDPPVVMDFKPLLPGLQAAGMSQRLVAGASIAVCSTVAARDSVLPSIRTDPFLIVRNRQDYGR